MSTRPAPFVGTFAVGTTVVDLDLPAGPFLRVEADDATLTLAGGVDDRRRSARRAGQWRAGDRRQPRLADARRHRRTGHGDRRIRTVRRHECRRGVRAGDRHACPSHDSGCRHVRHGVGRLQHRHRCARRVRSPSPASCCRPRSPATRRRFRSAAANFAVAGLTLTADTVDIGVTAGVLTASGSGFGCSAQRRRPPRRRCVRAPTSRSKSSADGFALAVRGGTLLGPQLGGDLTLARAERSRRLQHLHHPTRTSWRCRQRLVRRRCRSTAASVSASRHTVAVTATDADDPGARSAVSVDRRPPTRSSSPSTARPSTSPACNVALALSDGRQTTVVAVLEQTRSHSESPTPASHSSSPGDVGDLGGARRSR